MDLKEQSLKYALQNAVQFKGKPNPGAVIGKLLSENPELKSKIKEVSKIAREACEEVSKMSLEEQTKRLEQEAPDLLTKKKQKRDNLKELPDSIEGKFATRIPPEPSKHAHIGHAVSFLTNYLYAQKYKGKCFLRFEDTNPELSKQEYVDSILEDLDYLGIKPDSVKHVSDDMDAFYSNAEKLIQKDELYVCSCSLEDMRSNRQNCRECDCRQKKPEHNLKEWKKMLSREFEPGSRVLRLKSDMESKNAVMRDPVLFRISHQEHYRHGNKYSVWPLYDFENAVEDGTTGVTHILRSIEFGGMRVELQDRLKELLNLPKQQVFQYGRFNLENSLSQGREIRKMIEEKKVQGWDDPRLVTIKALARRGIQKETFRDLAIEFGISTTPTNVEWSVLSAHNRKYLDKSCSRYFFIKDPKLIEIMNAPSQEIKLKLHPDDDKPERLFSTDDKFFLSEKDASSLKDGSFARLMDCLNFSAGEKFVFDSLEIDAYREKKGMIIHWLPEKENLKARVLMPDATFTEGLVEKNASKIKIGEIVQFSRFGFCKLEKKSEVMEFIYCHD